MTTETLTVAASSFELTQIFNDEEFRDAAGGLWSSGRTGNRWSLSVTFNNITGNNRRAIWAHVGQLRGKQNRLRVPLSLLGYSAGGSGGGSPQIVGAHSAGATSLTFDGASAVATWLKGGDFLTIGNELKMVTGDVATNGSPEGTSSISIWPELHQNYSDNTALDISTPHGDFFLMNAQGLGSAPFPTDWLSIVTLTLEEDVYA